MIFSFYYSIVGVSVLISTMAIVGVIKFGLINPAELKGEVGTQRIGFLYLFGFWMLIYFITIERNGVFRKIFLATLIIIILSGIVLTFSRAAYLSFVISVCFYFYLKIRVLKLSINQISQILISILILFLSFVVLGLIYPELYEFIDNRFFLIFRDGNLVLTLSDSETSEGYRLSTWMEIFYFVISNPFTGSGFLGSWVYLPDQGSAHSEYIDRFGRLGIIGFLFYLFMLGKIYSFLLEKYRYLFISFTGAITYGFFHETFSLSHGAAIFSFILMLYAKFCRADSSTNRNAV